MAQIINKLNGDKTLVLGQREALVYPLPFEDWTSIRFGALMSSCSSAAGVDSNYGNFNIQLNITAPSDKFFFGLKYNNDSLPGENGEAFIGLLPASGNISSDFSSAGTPGNYSYVGTNGAFRSASLGALLPNGYQGDALIHQFYLQAPDQTAGTGNYMNFVGAVVTINNKGTSSQTITVKMATNSNFTQSNDPSDQALRDELSQNFDSYQQTYPWQVGGVPLPPPNALFAYLPFSQIQLRIHNIGTLKSS